MKKVLLTKLLIVCAILFCTSAYSQGMGSYYKVGQNVGEITKKVNLWGSIYKPGRYEVPMNTNLIQLITYSGGPMQHALMDEVKIFRLLPDSSRVLITIDLEDPTLMNKGVLELSDEDIVQIDYSSYVSWRETVTAVATPIAILASIALIIDRFAR